MNKSITGGLRTAILAAALALSGVAAADAQQAGPEVLVALPGERIENVFQARDGSLYFTAVLGGKVMRRTPDGGTTVFLAVHSPQGVLQTRQGFVVDYQDRDPQFGKGRLDLRGLGAHLAVLDASGKVRKTIDGPDTQSFFNGMGLMGDTTVFIADGGGDRILKADLNSGAVTVWLDSDRTHDPSAAPGAPNGLKVHDGWVYYSRGDVYRVKIGPDGAPQGGPVLAARTGGTDDFDVAPDGSVYASHGTDVLKAAPSGEVQVQVAGGCPFCTAVRVSRDGRRLFFTGGSLPIPGMASVPGYVRTMALQP